MSPSSGWDLPMRQAEPRSDETCRTVEQASNARLVKSARRPGAGVDEQRSLGAAPPLQRHYTDESACLELRSHDGLERTSERHGCHRRLRRVVHGGVSVYGGRMGAVAVQFADDRLTLPRSLGSSGIGTTAGGDLKRAGSGHLLPENRTGATPDPAGSECPTIPGMMVPITGRDCAVDPPTRSRRPQRPRSFQRTRRIAAEVGWSSVTCGVQSPTWQLPGPETRAVKAHPSALDQRAARVRHRSPRCS